MSAKPKITDEQFITAYMACYGNYAATARYIEQHYNIPFTQQAVRKRAKCNPNLQNEVRELLEDDFDFHLQQFAKDETVNIWLRARIYLELKAQLHRLNMKVQTVKKDKKGFFDIDGNIISFVDDDMDKEAFERIKKGERGAGIEAWKEQYDKKNRQG
jgi:hypothetical protein